MQLIGLFGSKDLNGSQSVTISMHSFFDSERYCRTIGINAKGTILVGQFGLKCLRIYNLQTFQEVDQVNGNDDLKSLSITPDGQTVITTDHDNLIHFLDFSTQRRLGSVDQASFVFQSNYLSQDREIIAAMIRDRDRSMVEVWQLSTGKVLGKFVFPDIFCFALSLDGKVLVAGNEDYEGGMIKAWNIATGGEIFSQRVYNFVPREYTPYLDGSGDETHGVTGISISPDNSTIVYQLRGGGGVHLLNLATQVKRQVFGANGLGDFSANGNSLILSWGAVFNCTNGMPAKDPLGDKLFRVRTVPMSDNGRILGCQMIGGGYSWVEVRDRFLGKTTIIGEKHKI